MPPAPEPRETTPPPGEPPRHPRRWRDLALFLALGAACAGVLLFVLLVVAPSAGAAGGCGGG